MNYEDFDNFNIEEASIKFEGDEEATEYGCVGTLDVEPEQEDLSKTCGLKLLKSKKITKWLTVTINAFVKRKVSNSLYGLTNEGLAEGVYGLPADAKTKQGVFAAVVTDFDGNRKLIAFPIVENAAGLKMSIDNAATEVGQSEIEFKALQDENGFFYYEAMEGEIIDSTLKQKWLSNFTPELVKSSTVSYTITYDPNGGTGTVDPDIYTGTPITLDDGSTLTGPEDKPVFKGWAKTSSSQSATVNSPYTPTASTTLYAVWATE